MWQSPARLRKPGKIRMAQRCLVPSPDSFLTKDPTSIAHCLFAGSEELGESGLAQALLGQRSHEAFRQKSSDGWDTARTSRQDRPGRQGRKLRSGGYLIVE